MLGNYLAHHAKQIDSNTRSFSETQIRNGLGRASNPATGHLLPELFSHAGEVPIHHPARKVDRKHKFATRDSVKM
jgi:hypothetical protein